MRKANRDQVVGNLSTRGGVHPSQKETRFKAEEALAARYHLARADCAKNPNNHNRRVVDGLQKRLIRRQVRALRRFHSAD